MLQCEGMKEWPLPLRAGQWYTGGMKVLLAEATPNPNAVKFVLDGSLIEAGSKHFDHAPSVIEDPVAAGLFDLKNVISVYYGDSFVTITSNGSGNWLEVKSRLGELLEDRVPAKRRSADASSNTSTDDELLPRINKLLDEYVRPALAGDGGGLEVMGLEGPNLFIRYQGACGTCPSAAMGTLMAIQNMIRTELNVPVNVIPA